MAEKIPILVAFGRPGAGKTTIANAAIIELKSSNADNCLIAHGLDLDVCVPQWMKDNFAKGLYPTLKQRNVFASACCDYVKKELEAIASSTRRTVAIISFSFVNTDLRNVFRSHFPNATWILIDTSEKEATRRINARQDHFYKGDTTRSSNCASGVTVETTDSRKADVDNSDWNFAPVTFEHRMLDGNQPIDVNAKKFVEVVAEKASKTLHWN